MTELRPFLLAAARHLSGSAVGLGLAWSVLAGAGFSLGAAPAEQPALFVHLGSAAGGLDITLQP